MANFSIVSRALPRRTSGSRERANCAENELRWGDNLPAALFSVGHPACDLSHTQQPVSRSRISIAEGHLPRWPVLGSAASRKTTCGPPWTTHSAVQGGRPARYSELVGQFRRRSVPPERQEAGASCRSPHSGVSPCSALAFIGSIRSQHWLLLPVCCCRWQ